MHSPLLVRRLRLKRSLLLVQQRLQPTRSLLLVRLLRLKHSLLLVQRLRLIQQPAARPAPAAHAQPAPRPAPAAHAQPEKAAHTSG
jgi:hypothetical protein